MKPKAWIIGRGIVVPMPDDPRWSLTHNRPGWWSGYSWASIGEVHVTLDSHLKAYVEIAGRIVGGFRAWRYGRRVRAEWRARVDREWLEKQKAAALEAINQP